MNKQPVKSVYEFDEFQLDAAELMLYRSENEISLPRKAVETLLVLVESRGEIISKDDLIARVWSDTVVEESNLSHYLYILRKTLGNTSEGKPFIETFRRRGYRFNGEVRTRTTAPPHAPAPISAAPNYGVERRGNVLKLVDRNEAEAAPLEKKVSAGEAKAAVPLPGKRSNFMIVAAAGLIAVVLLAGLSGFYLSRRGDARADFTENAPIKTIAVLPFKPLIAENRDEALEMGMADTLIAKLGSGEAIVVRPLSSVRRFAGLEQDSIAAGRELKADAVLDGTIQTSGERVRVSARLIRTSDGKQLWAGQFDEKFTDIFAVQDSITEKASAALRTKLEKRPKSSTENVEAYQLYLKGRFHFLKVTRPGTEKAVSYFEQAIQTDPNFALAYAGLADAYRGLAINGEMSPSEFLPKAKAAAQKAVELDDTLSDAHAVLGFIVFWLDWDWQECERHYKRALELNPNNADALIYYANLHSNLGRHPEALAFAKRARELDPLNLRTGALEAQFLIHAGQSDQALERLQKTLELDPNYWFANIFSASAYIEKGMYSEAIEHARRAGGIYDSSRVNAFLGYALAKAGREREARAELERTLKLAAEKYVSPYNVAMIYNGLGKREETLRWLERGYEQREPRMIILKAEPKWSNLRTEPRFIEIMRRMNLQ